MSNVTFKANRYLLVTTKRLTKQPKQMEKRGDGADKEKVSIPPPLYRLCGAKSVDTFV